MARVRFRKVPDEAIDSPIKQILFDAPPNTFLAIFDADVRIECDKGEEMKVAAAIQEWVRKKLMPLIVIEPPKEEPTPENLEPIVG